MINDLAIQPTWTTSSITTQFERFAEIVSVKAAELLSAQVFALDEQGLLIASSDTSPANLFFNSPVPREVTDYLRVPFCVDGRAQSSSWANLVALRRAADALLTRLRADTGASINIGIGHYHPGLLGLAHSYEDARAALCLGRRFNGHNRVYCLDQLGVAAFIGVSDERTKIELALHLLSPLDHEPELLATLAVFFNDDCCPSLASTELSIHRNTLSYRLDKITSLTGLDPRHFDDAVQIRLALLLRSLRTGPNS